MSLKTLLLILLIFVTSCVNNVPTEVEFEEDEVTETSNDTDDEVEQEKLALGAQLYRTSCKSCHGPLEISTKLNRSFFQIQKAILEFPQMRHLEYLPGNQIVEIEKALSYKVPYMSNPQPFGLISSKPDVSTEVISLNTDELSGCRYDERNLSFSKMANSFQVKKEGNSYIHTASIEKVENKQHIYFVQCQDRFGHTTENPLIISFSYDQQRQSDLVPPVLSIISPKVNEVLESGVTEVAVEVETNEAASCNYIDSIGQSKPMRQTNGSIHKHTISELSAGRSYKYFIICEDSSKNTSSPTEISFQTPEVLLDGAELYEISCKRCHGDLAVSTKKDRSGIIIKDAIDNNFAMKNIDQLKSLTYPQINAIAEVLKTDIQIDNAVPILVNNSVSNVSTSGAIISVNFNEDVTVQIEYGESSGLGEIKSSMGLKKTHQLSLINLKDNTQYTYKINAIDMAGNVYSSNLLSFKTLEEVGEPLVLLGLNVSNISETSATVNWSLSSKATGEVEYWEKELGQVSSKRNTNPDDPKDDSLDSSTHSMTLRDLKPGTSYLAVVHSKDSFGTEVSTHNPIEFKTNSPVVEVDYRVEAQRILQNQCIFCHGEGAPYKSVFDLSVDIEVLEQNKKYITPGNPGASFFYQKITSGSMNKYLGVQENAEIFKKWIEGIEEKELVINCNPGEEALDNVCVKVGKPFRSHGYRMVTPKELFRDVNNIFKLSLTNIDPSSGQSIVPEPSTTHGFNNQFGLISANSVYVSSISRVADLVAEQLRGKSDFNSKIVTCMNEAVSTCGMKVLNEYATKLFRQELKSEDLKIYQDYFATAQGSKQEIYIDLFKALIQSPSFIFREEHGVGGSLGNESSDPSSPLITEISLYNAATDKVIQQIPLNSNIVLNTAVIGSQLSIEAKGSNLGSVRFKSTDHEQTERAIPYVFSGDNGVDIYPWSLGVGKHVVEIVAFKDKTPESEQSPKVILNIEIINNSNEPGVKILSVQDSTYKLNSYEVASRLSYFVTGRGPDAILRAKASDGTIMQKSVREAEAQRLMTSSYAQQHLAETFMESIGIKKLAHEDQVASDMIRETRTLVRKVFFGSENQKWTDIFTANYTFINKRLADIYKYNVNVDNANFVKVNYPDNKRSGILSHASYLSAFYDGKDLELTKDIRRGINFYEKILCRSMPLPPADVDVDLDPAADLNGCRVDNRKASTLSPQGTCIQCHQHFDRIGMGFERFNNLGEFRTHEKEDSSCSTIEPFYLDGNTRFEAITDFTTAVSQNNNVGRCLALKMKSYAYGSEGSHSDIKSIFLEMNNFKQSMNFKDLIKDIVGNDQFIERESRDEK